MAGKTSAKGAVIVVDDSGGSPQTISSDVVSYTLEQNYNPIDVTGFGDGSQNFIPGLPVYGISLDVLWNTTATTGATTVLSGIIGNASSKTITITPESGTQKLSGEFMLDALPTSGTPTGRINIGTVHFSVMGSVAPTWAS